MQSTAITNRLARSPINYLDYDDNHFPEDYNPELHLKVINFRYGLSIVKKHLQPYFNRKVIKFQRLWLRYWNAMVYDERQKRYLLSPEAMVDYNGTLVTRHCLADLTT